MKKLLIINGLIFSTLTISAQNLTNVSFNNDNNINTQQSVNYYSNVNVVQVQSNNRGNRGGSSALSNFNENNNDDVQTANLPKQKKTVKVNNKPIIQTNVNVVDNNVGNMSNPQVITNKNVVNDVNLNPQVNTTHNKPVNNKPIVIEESHGSDFKQIGLSGRDYSNGGKMKKGVKNFPQPEKTKPSRVKPKLKHLKVKKVKYHTSKCANW